MCWSATASVVMVALGGAATAVTILRKEPKGIPLALGYFTAMEALQAVGYSVVDQCGTPANAAVTLLSYLHIAFQPVFINLFALAITPDALSLRFRQAVLALAGAASVLLLLRLLPFGALGHCQPGEVLCGAGLCTLSGEWHIAWHLPLNNWNPLPGLPAFTAYVLAVFVLPLVYGAWRFALFHLLAGPGLAALLTDNPNEWPAVWCLFSIGLVLISLSPPIRRHVSGVARVAG